MHDHPSQILLRPEEAAQYLAIGRTEIFKLIKSGDLESVTIGRLRRIPVAACDRFVAMRTSG